MKCVRVYHNYLHGWNQKVNIELEATDDHLMPMKLCRQDVSDDVLLGLVQNDHQINDLVAEYQAFLAGPSDDSNADQSEVGIPQTLDNDHDSSLIPNVGDTHMGTNTTDSDSSLTELWTPNLEQAQIPSTTQPFNQIEFNLGIESASTQRSRSGRTVVRHDYGRADKEGF